MIRLTHISKEQGRQSVLSNASFALNKGDKAALVGPNGVGKTTLLKIIAGFEEPDSGEVELADRTSIGYVTQDTNAIGDMSVAEYIRRQTGAEMPKHKIESVLSGLGFNTVELEGSTSLLSGGQKMKLGLAAILLKNDDLLLLDEPTNNLDLPSMIWLEDFIIKSSATAIIVSHDRVFLDRITNKVIEIDWLTRKTTVCGGKYGDYIEMSLKRIEKARQDYLSQQEEIDRLTERAKKLKFKADAGSRWSGTDNDKMLRGFKRDRAGGSSRRAKVIEKRIDRMDKLERPVEKERLEIRLKVPKNPGSLHIALKETRVGYHGGFSTNPISVSIAYGNRVGILGLNGSGKSTLLKTITGELSPLDGTVEVGSGIRFGNMTQEHEALNKGETPLLFLARKAGLDMQNSYALSAKIGFTRRQAERPIKELSPGGRARLVLASFSAIGVNALVLDEPTNHLDFEALNALEEILSKYSGTVIIVSHDRYFIEKAQLDSIYQIEDGTLRKITDFKEYVASAELRAKRLIRLL